MPWWRKQMMMYPRPPKKIQFTVRDGVVIVGGYRGYPKPRNENCTVLFVGTNPDLCGFAIGYTTYGVIVGTFLSSAPRERLPYEPLYPTNDQEINPYAITEIIQDSVDIFNGYVLGGLEYHASRWNVQVPGLQSVQDR